MLEQRKTSWVLDADIKGFFDHLDHRWIVRFVGSRINDPNMERLLVRRLKGGIMENCIVNETEEGSGQGSVCSPIIANIYMHYVLIWWFKERMQPFLKGFSGLVVYADDFVACFQYREEAYECLRHLRKRMMHFGLELEENKTRLIEFGRFAADNRRRCGKGKPETFTFLGFTHYCSKGRNGKFRVKRKTSRKKFAKKCKELNLKIKAMRTWDLDRIFKHLNQILVGYYHYYGITDNFEAIARMKDKVQEMLFYWLNHRSQRESYTWDSFNKLLTAYPLAKPRIYVSIYQ